MSTSGQATRSAKAALYGIVFRVLCGLAVQAGHGEGEPAPQEASQARRQAQERRPLQPHPSVRANLDPGR